MAFIKLVEELLDSSLWPDPVGTRVFLTAALMAKPYELEEPAEQLDVRTMAPTGFVVPAGFYGLVKAAGVGIANRALVDQEAALEALARLGSADLQSKNPEHDGRRLVRVRDGFLVLNYFRYRDRDHTAAERQQRLRTRKKQGGKP